MEGVCRACTSSDVTLVDIFIKREQEEEQEEEQSDLCLAKMLSECVGCEIRSDDPFPKQICLSCVLEAQNAYKFKRKCERSQQHFHELLKKQNSFVCKKEIEEVEDIVETEEYRVDEMPIKVETDENCSEEKERAEAEANETSSETNETSSELNHIPTSESIAGSSIEPEQDYCNDIPHVCEICGKGFINKTQLILHGLDHRHDNSNKCPHCGKVFTYRGCLHKHILPHCPKAFQQLQQKPQQEQQQTLQPVVIRNVDKFQCSLCPRYFNNKLSLKEHLRVHSTKYQCSHCFKNFSRKGHLETHIRVHSGERPFTCTHCPKTFSQRSNLYRHSRVHSPAHYKCSYCPKKFILREYLDKHNKYYCPGTTN